MKKSFALILALCLTLVLRRSPRRRGAVTLTVMTICNEVMINAFTPSWWAICRSTRM